MKKGLVTHYGLNIKGDKLLADWSFEPYAPVPPPPEYRTVACR